jgi:hypothetical protein
MVLVIMAGLDFVQLLLDNVFYMLVVAGVVVVIAPLTALLDLERLAAVMEVQRLELPHLQERLTLAVAAAVLGLLLPPLMAVLAALGLSSFVGLHPFQHPLPQQEALR